MQDCFQDPWFSRVSGGESFIFLNFPVGLWLKWPLRHLSLILNWSSILDLWGRSSTQSSVSVQGFSFISHIMMSHLNSHHPLSPGALCGDPWPLQCCIPLQADRRLTPICWTCSCTGAFWEHVWDGAYVEHICCDRWMETRERGEHTCRRRRHSAHSGHSHSAFEGAYWIAELVIRFHSEAADRIANALTNIWRLLSGVEGSR